jgi:hypothetical protein
MQDQQGVLDNLRARAGLLLSAAAVASSFLGAQALTEGLEPLTWLALALFAVVGILAVALLWPQSEWVFSQSPARIIQEYIEGEAPQPLAAMQRNLALHLEDTTERTRGASGGCSGLFRRWRCWSPPTSSSGSLTSEAAARVSPVPSDKPSPRPKPSIRPVGPNPGKPETRSADPPNIVRLPQPGTPPVRDVRTK